MNFVPATITNAEEQFSLPIVCHFALAAQSQSARLQPLDQA